MLTPVSSKCPAHSNESSGYTFVFKELPHQNIILKFGSMLTEWLSRLSPKSIKNGWLVASQDDTTKMYELTWKKEEMISKCRTLAGTVYFTGNTDVMKVIFQNPRASREGLFWDQDNTTLLIKTLMADLYPEDLDRLDLDTIREMIIFTANQEHIKMLRSPLMSVLGAAAVKKHVSELNKVADHIFDSFTEEEKLNYDGEKLGFEFATTCLAKLITNYETTRENYIALAKALNIFGEKMAKLISYRTFNKSKQKEYQEAILTIRKVIDTNISATQPSLLITKMKELGWDNFQIRANLFFVYFAGAETTASSINYLLWQLTNDKNKHVIEKLSDPEHGETYTSQVVAEALRLHPASFVQGRQFRKDTLFEAYDSTGKLVRQLKLKRNHSIICLVPIAALNPAKFVNPMHFDPDRFEGDNLRTQLSWLPFGAGTHVCPGQYQALAELQVFTSRLVNKFNIELVQPDAKMEQKGIFTLRANPVRIKLINRN